MHQVGVFGRLNDGEEVLLFLMQDERGVEIPASGTNANFAFDVDILLAVSNKANISLTVAPQVQALMKLVEAEIKSTTPTSMLTRRPSRQRSAQP